MSESSPTQPTFIGVDYPLNDNKILNFVTDHNAINAGLYQLLMTEPGERLFEPSFGTPLRDLIFEVQDDTTIELVTERIAASIQVWEPRIVLPMGLAVSSSHTEENPQYKNMSQQENAVYVGFRWQFKIKLNELFEFSALISRSQS